MRTLAPLIVSLDLEFNQPSERIIQVGAVVGDLQSGQVLTRFSCYVNPQEPLAEAISTLCGIAPPALELAGSLQDAYAAMQAWLQPFRYERQLNPLTWGGGDSMALKQQLKLEERWAFGRRWVDVKTVYIAWQHAQGRVADGGLRTSMRKVGLSFTGRQHDATDDAHNTFLMYYRLLSLIRAGLPTRICSV